MSDENPGSTRTGSWRYSSRTITLVVLAAIAYLPALASSPGRMPADSKLYVYLNPGRFFGDAASTFDPRQFGGWVPHQHMSYLWPTDPWFWTFDTLGVPDWVAHRLWIGSLLFAAGTGVWWFARRSLDLPAAAALVAALSYQTSLYILPYISRTSVMLLPWAGLGWIIALTARGLTRRGWRDPALLALVVFTVGGVNATALALIVPGPVLWLIHAKRTGLASWPDVGRVVWRTGLLSLAVSLWWIQMLVLQGRYGADVLAYSETLADVSYTSTAPEVWRSLGYWLFYIRTHFGPATTASWRYLMSAITIGLSFGVTVVALAGLAFTRWVHRTFALAMVAVGAILAVGVHPIDHQSPLFRTLTRGGDGGIALALRSSTRALPLMVLGLSLGLASIVAALQGRSWSIGRRRVRAATAGAVVFALMLLANNPQILRARLVDPAIERDEDPPQAWVDAAATIDAQRDSGAEGRVLQIPGVEFGAYRWGYTVDQPLPSLTEAGLVTRDLLPLGSPSTMDLLYALDDRIQDGVLESASVAPVARLLGADTIWLTNDVEYERFGTTRPQRIAPLLDAAPGLSDATVFGPPRAYPVTIPMLQPDTLARPDGPVEAVALYHVDDPRPRDSVARSFVALSGSGAGVVDAAAAGLIDGTAPVVYTAAGLADAQPIDGLVVTDSNRDQARHWRSSQDTLGFTESGGPQQDVLRPLAGDRRLDLFASSEPATQTVAVQEGPVEARASSYGEPFSYLPEHRPFMAIDGDPTTSWTVGEHGDPVGEFLELTLARPLTFSTTFTFTQATTTPYRMISAATFEAYSREGYLISSWPVSFDGGSATPVSIPADTASLRVRIDAVGTGLRVGGRDVNGVGFAEVTSDLGPSVEVVRVPDDGVATLGQQAPRVDYVFTRWRADQFDRARSDPETTLVREFDVPDRTLTPSVTVRLDPRVSDDELRDLFDLPVTALWHLRGSIASSAGAAFDGDPATMWVTPFDTIEGSFVEFRTTEPTAQLTVTQPLSGYSPITELTVSAGGDSRAMTLAPDASGTSTMTLDPPVPAGLLRIRITGIDKFETTDRRFGDPTYVPAALVDISGPSVPAVAPSDQWTFTSGCQPVATVDGTPIEAKLTLTPGQSFDDPLTAEVCSPDLQLDGSNRLVTSDDLPAGLQLDRVVLTDTAVAPAAVPPRAVSATGDTDHHRVVVDDCDDGCWLLDDVASNEAWSATDGSASLTAIPLAGSGQAWRLSPDDQERTVDIAWTLQGRFNRALIISLAAVVACIVLALRRPRLAHVASPHASTPPTWIESGTTRWRMPSSSDWPNVLGAVALGAVLAGALVQPVWALAGGLVAGLALVARRRLIEIVALLIVAVTGVTVAASVASEFLPPDGGWPHQFEGLHPIAMFAIALIALAAVWPFERD